MATRKASQAALEAFGAGAARARSAGRPISQARTTRNFKGVDDAHGRRRRRQLHALRRARVRHGRDHERDGRCTAASFPYGGTFLVFSDYARNALRMACADAAALDLRAYARLDRPRRGRPDAPADRARRASLRLMPQHARSGGRATRSRPRSRGAPRSSATTARRSWSLTRQDSAARAAHAGADRRRSRAAAMCSSNGDGDAREITLIATGSEVQLAVGAAARARQQRASRRASCRCRARGVRCAGRGVPRRACCRQAACGSRSRPARRVAGGAMSGERGGVHGIDAFGAVRHRRRPLFEKFGFTVAAVQRR